ncbi:MAG TPA: glycosyltransferase family 4 protein [Longimicrobiales bacterium]
MTVHDGTRAAPLAATERTPRLLFVGAFPPPGREMHGGNVTDCRVLLASSFAQRLDLVLVDTTQVSNPPPGVLVRAGLALRRLITFVARFETSRPDAILLFVATGASVLEKGLMAWYARLRGVPSLFFPRGGALMDDYRRSARTRAWVRPMLDGATRILCQGEAWQEFVTRDLGRPVADAPIVRNWTASSELLEIGARRAARPAGAPTRLLFVGWLTREKGILELIDACARLGPENAFTLDLVGEGALSEDARRAVREKGLDAVVTFRGWLDPEQLRDVYAAADVLVLPSWVEGLPNVMIEAMAAGLAVVITPVGDVPSVITHEVNGLVVPPRDAATLAATLQRVIGDGALRHRLARRGFEDAAARFGVEQAADRLVDIIEDVRPDRSGG